jgi:hypothetical protein
MPKKKPSTEMAYTEQPFYPNSQENLGETNAVPRCTEYDLKPGERKDGGFLEEFFQSVRPTEQTFTVPKRGNCVTKGKNY